MPRKMKSKAAVPEQEPPSKRTKLFDDDAAASDDDVNLTINEEFARRFEHNKKREEMQRRMHTRSRSIFYHMLIHPSRGEVQERRRRRIVD